MPFYLYTGRGPSSAAPRLKVLALLGVHRLRHVAPFLRGVSLAASNSLVSDMLLFPASVPSARGDASRALAAFHVHSAASVHNVESARAWGVPASGLMLAVGLLEAHIWMICSSGYDSLSPAKVASKGIQRTAGHSDDRR